MIKLELAESFRNISKKELKSFMHKNNGPHTTE